MFENRFNAVGGQMCLVQVAMTFISSSDEGEHITKHESLYIIEINRLTNDVRRLRTNGKEAK